MKCNRPAEFKVLSDAPLPFNSKGEIRWHLVNFTPDMEKFEQISILSDVFGFYNYELYPLRFMSSANFTNSYFRVAFVDKDGYYSLEGKRQKSPHTFDVSTLAVAYAKSRSRWSGWIFINDDFFWTVLSQHGKHILKLVFQHEIGHAVGLDHTNHPGDIMLPEYSEGNTWTQDSRNGLNRLLGHKRLSLVEDIPSAKFIQSNVLLKSNPLKQSRGLRNNNPGNIRISGSKWKGKYDRTANTDGAFEQFIHMGYGVRAMIRLIRDSYIKKKGINTISEIVQRYAPASENNTYAYIESVSKRSGFGPTQLIRHKKGDIKRLIMAMIFHENGAGIDDKYFELGWDLS